MESLATPGSIVVCEDTHKLTEGYFQFKALGPVKVKGATEPVEIYEVTGIGAVRTRLQVAARRGLVRFVGFVRFVGCVGFVGFVGLVGFVGFVVFVRFVRFV